MAKIKTLYEKEEDIPEGFGDLFTERNGKWEMTGVEGVKTQADIDRVNEALRKEKADHKALKEKHVKVADLDPEKVAAQAAELEAAQAQLAAFTKDGKLDETKLEPVIEARIKRALGPIERDKAALERKLADEAKAKEAALGEVTTLKTSITQRTIENALRDAALAGKVITSAVDDAVLVGARYFETTEDGRVLTKDNMGITPGLKPTEWFKDMQEHKPHWWPASQGGGSRGGSGGTGGRADNPWMPENWNITKQGAYVQQHGMEKAVQAATAANSKIGNTKPTPKAAAAA